MSLVGFLLFDETEGSEDFLYAPSSRTFLDSAAWTAFFAQATICHENGNISFHIKSAKNKYTEHAAEFFATFDKRPSLWPTKLIMKREKCPFYIVATVEGPNSTYRSNVTSGTSFLQAFPLKIQIDTLRVDNNALIERIVYRIKSLEIVTHVDSSIFTIDPQMSGKVENLDRRVLLPMGRHLGCDHS